MKKMLLGFLSAFLLAGCQESAVHGLNVSLPSKELSATPLLAKPLIHHVRLAATGDVLIHESIYKDASVSHNEFNFHPMFEKVTPYLSSADITVVNQETIIGGTELGLGGYPSFNSPVEVGEALKEAGVDIVTIANNHTLDRGEKGVLTSIQNWESLGMPYTGSFSSAQDQTVIRTLTKNTIVFSFLSYTYGTNGIKIPDQKEYLVNLINKEQMRAELEKAEALSDVQVVSMHWGNEYEPLPSPEQQDLAQFLSDAGADIIIGHHPHVLQPPAWITGRNGNKTYVFYSLGNFLSAQIGTERLLGGIMDIQITKKTTDDQTTVTLHSPSFVPVYTYHHQFKDFRLFPMNQLNDQLLPSFQQHREQAASHLSTYIPDLSIR